MEGFVVVVHTESTPICDVAKLMEYASQGYIPC